MHPPKKRRSAHAMAQKVAKQILWHVKISKTGMSIHIDKNKVGAITSGVFFGLTLLCLHISKEHLKPIDERANGRKKRMGSGSGTFESAVITHADEIKEEMTMKTQTNFVLKKTSTSGDTTAILRVHHKKAWENGCNNLTKNDGEMQTFTEAKTCRGG